VKRAAVLFMALALSACATARLHSQDELNVIGQRCGVQLGEIFQDESEKRLVFLFKPGATAEQRGCVARWARRNGLKTVFVDNIAFPESGS
jgi:hypothetical protein